MLVTGECRRSGERIDLKAWMIVLLFAAHGKELTPNWICLCFDQSINEIMYGLSRIDMPVLLNPASISSRS